ncbi:MAG: hypothetical protein CM15mP77_2900 [Synechococcus sp.]|nr:MAG: hypothetical protein CM15mP77_2900 [Synechococcus sp.]
MRKLDDEVIGSIDPGAFEGLTPKQGEKMNEVVASNFDPAQIRSIQPECLAAMPGPVLEILESDLSDQQLNGLEALQGQGDGEDIGATMTSGSSGPTPDPISAKNLIHGSPSGLLFIG